MALRQDALSITLERTQGAQRDAARIWARASAVRDGRPDLLDDTDRALAHIRRRLTLPDATLHVASRGNDNVGFVLLVPRGATLEITHLAVDPNHWSQGLAASLLHYVESQARLLRFTVIDAWVVADNQRAARRYESAGFSPTTDVQDAGGRLERRMELQLF